MLDIFKQIYLNSILYDKKISKAGDNYLEYRPSSHLLSSIVKVKNKKLNIDDFSLESVWTNNNLNQKQLNKLNNFFWLFSIDLKSSNTSVQLIIKNWIQINKKYNFKSWGFDTTSKRLIAWLSNSKLTYDQSDENYKKLFSNLIRKQTFHLLNQIDKIEIFNEKLTGIASIILVGLSYKDEKNFISKGLGYLKKILKSSLDNFGFPKSRSIKQSIFLLKYLIIIREWFKESQLEIPEFINEHIYYLGQSYSFFWKNLNFDPLFNGNNISDNQEFDNYLKRLGYSFENKNSEFSDYVILKNKKINLLMDIGPSPIKKFSNEYQAGALSFEFISNGKKIFTNSGYYNNKNPKLNQFSRSSASHNVLIIDDNSSCKFKKKSNDIYEINEGLKITKKKIIFEKNYWNINAAHDGYLKKYNILYEREIEFYPENNKIIGIDKLIGKKIISNLKFDIRFHLNSAIKIMKTQDNKSILIDADGEGWRFTCNNYKIDIDKGLFFGKKNTSIENQNIFISGIINSQNNNITWEIVKI